MKAILKLNLKLHFLNQKFKISISPSIYTITKENSRTKVRIRRVISDMVIAKYISKKRADIASNNLDYIFVF